MVALGKLDQLDESALLCKCANTFAVLPAYSRASCWHRSFQQLQPVQLLRFMSSMVPPQCW